MKLGTASGIAGILTLLALLLPYAQGQTVSLAGAVADSWAIAVPGANLTLTNSQTRAELKCAANTAGEYVLSPISPGRYDLSVRAGGFKSFARQNIQIDAAKADAGPHLDVKLDREKEDASLDVKELEKQVAGNRDDYAAHFNLGRAYFARNQFDNAVHQFQETLRLQPDYRPAKLGMARVALQFEHLLTTAAQTALDLIKLNPGDGPATLIAATAFMRLKQPDDAADQLDKLLKIRPYDTDALNESGSANLQGKHYPEAEAAFRRAYRLDPSDLRGLRGVADVFFAMNQPEKAVQAMASEVEKDPQSADLRRELGTAEFRSKEFDKALADFSSTLEKYQHKPMEQADVYDRIGLSYQGKGDLPRAIENLKKATQLAPDKALYFATLAAVYDASGKSKEALDCYRLAIKLDPRDPILWNNAAYLSARSGGDLDEALRMVLMAREQLPDVTEVLDTLGWVYLKKELVDSACQVYQDLIEKAPANATYRYHYALALSQKGNKAAALEQLDVALKNKPAKSEEEQIRELIKKLS